MDQTIKDKITKIFEISGIAKNLARRKFILELILGIISARNVQFNEISLHINSKSKTTSIERRIQAFFEKFIFDYAHVAGFLVMLMPSGKLTICIDRTEWDFGSFQCNILVITVRLRGVGLPLFWELLDNKSGNSHATHRIELLQKAIDLVGLKRIDCVIGDREFIGIKWLKWLKENNIKFCFRVPQSHSITLKNGKTYFIETLLQEKNCRYFHDCIVDGIRCNIYLKKLENKEYLFLIGSHNAKNLGCIYRLRWSIEVCFQALKERGFNLENTHLYKAEKIKKLLVFVSIALALCINFGIFLHEKIEKIKTKKHGYKANSFFRYGMDAIRKLLKGREENDLQIIKALDYLLRWIKIQIANNQLII